MNLLFRSFLCFLFVSCLSNCTIGFNRQWKKAATSQAPADRVSLDGAWEGTWLSEGTGHRGTLRAIATALPSKGQPLRYEFRYKATWKKVLRAVFHAEHDAKREGDHLVLSGEKDLGVFGGVYRFKGTATPLIFRATYESKMDHGVFDMKRPGTK